MATGAPGRVYTAVQRSFRPTLETRDLPKGICGRVTGVALVYGVEDSHGTSFALGCLDRTKRERLAAGKVSLYADHAYGIRTHVGVVRTLTTVGTDEMLAADLFDTEDGRHAKEYLEAVVAAGGYTGFSIGFYNRSVLEVDTTDPAETAYTFTEIELDEVSLTPRPAVPGADVQGVRQDNVAAAWRLLDLALTLLPVDDVRARMAAREEGKAAGPTDTSHPGHTPAAGADATESRTDPPPVTGELVTIEQRRAALAALYDMEIV